MINLMLNIILTVLGIIFILKGNTQLGLSLLATGGLYAICVKLSFLTVKVGDVSKNLLKLNDTINYISNKKEDF